MIRFAFVLFAILVLAGTSAAQDANCAIDAWVEHRDPRGLNVRAKPDLKAKIVGKLRYDNGDDNEIVMVKIVGYAKGWVKISGASTVGGDELFSGNGWVTAKAVILRTERPDGNSAKRVALYSRPSKAGGVASRIPAEVAVRIRGFACFGPKVTYSGKTGWLSREDLCGNPVTTCP